MATVGYYAVGNSRDWHIAGDLGLGTKQKTYGYTVEVGNGSLGFWPEPENIIPIAKSMFFANVQMAYMAGSYFELQDMDPVAVTSTSGDFGFSLRRIGLTDAPVTVTISPVENIATINGSVTVNSFANYFDTVQRQIGYTLPAGLVAGSRIRFAYEISSGGITIRDTITKLFQPVTLLADNMEWASNPNWSLSGGWGTSTGASYQGTRALTESPSGNYASGSTSTATYNTSFDLSNASAAYLSFWVRHRAENAYDKIQVQVSTGGSYLSVCGNNTVSENIGTLGSQPALTGMRDAWTREVIDLRNYLGNSSVNLRFRFTSNGATGYDGFYLDNMEFVKSSLILLSSKFTSLQAKQAEEGVELTWQATVSAEHDRFEVERSADGTNFISLGTVKGVTNLRFVDQLPAGVNYYRVKAVDKAGRTDYSRIVTIETTHITSVQAYPNPVSKVMVMRFQLVSPSGLLLKVTDIAGRPRYQQTIQATKGITDCRIDVSHWPAQVYLLHVSDPRTGQVSVLKMIKQ
jgi:hypothetical protein